MNNPSVHIEPSQSDDDYRDEGRMSVTHWLWYGERVVGSIRAEISTPVGIIKDRALAQLETCPGVYCGPGDLPDSLRIMICNATVKVYAGER